MTSGNYNLFNIFDFSTEPEKVAIIDYDSNACYTYQNLENFINSAARFLKDQKIQKNQRVALVSANSSRLIFLYLAILKIGATAVFINKKYPTSILLNIIEDSRPEIILLDKFLKFSNVKSFLIDEVFLNTIECKNIDVEKIENDQAAIIMYTSGSSGLPKGVILTHKNHSWIIKKRAKEKNQSIKNILLTTPLYHMTALSNLEISLASNSTVMVMKEFFVNSFFDIMQQHHVDQISSVPAVMAMIVKSNNKIYKNIKSIILGSSPISPSLYKKIKEVFPSAYIKIAYGLTEVGPGLFDKHPDGVRVPDLSVGYPIKGIQYRIVDGILQIKSPSMMKSYTNKCSNNVTEDGFFITNDLFEVDENGFYYFKGRSDDMFVCGGYNIFPKKIENILESYNDIDQAAVIPVQDEIKGHKPYAFVVSKSEITDDTLLFLKKHLPPVEIPRKIWRIDSIPVNNSNKIDKIYLIRQANVFLKNEK